ncbi:MAG: long-chain-fatty-acid--CoA ligase [Bdellovibrio sp.]|nr:MAG: long-chain-fatty-acid--CoA ligase [Bdellovibrio sp.]
MEKIWLKSYPKEIPHEINPDQYTSLTDMILQALKKYKGKPAFENMGAAVSFEELDELSSSFAAFLQYELRLRKGDRLAIQIPNLIQYPIALFGALKAGVVVVNTNPLYTEREMKHQFKDSGAKAIVILESFASKLEEILDDVPIEHVIVTGIGDQLGWPKSWLVNGVVKYVKKMVPAYHLPRAYRFNEALSIGQEKKYVPVEVQSSDIAFLQYTGGTTGVAKGAMLTHRNIVSNILQMQAWLSPYMKADQERIITALPLYHIFSLSANCLTFFTLGGSNFLITNPRDIDSFVKTLKKTEFTALTGVNTLFNALLNHPDIRSVDFSRLRICVAGGMALQQSVAKRWIEVTGSRIIEGYGLTESSPVVCANPLDGSDKLGTIGLPLPSTDIQFCDDTGQEVALGEAGELWVKGPQVMKGYWNRPEETQKVLTPEGWLKTGDIAQMDEEGFVKIVDRKKDMILVSGFNVYPNEIEDVISHLDGVLEVAAVGVPDEKSGEAVKVFIVKSKASLTEEQVREFCKENLVAYKRPKYIEFRKELPKTNVGKILRRALREEDQNLKKEEVTL